MNRDLYPEHLNPFADDVKKESKRSIRQSFRTFKKTLGNSFRIKTKSNNSDITLRHHDIQIRHGPVSLIERPDLPRSRFHERVTIHSSRTSINPFDDDDDEPQTRRKEKKRAPLPPKSASAQNLNGGLSVSTANSEWSLNSTYSNINLPEVTQNHSLDEKFVDFNRNMECLQDDANNNNIECENNTDMESAHIPESVLSYPKVEDIELTQEEDFNSNNIENQSEEKINKVELDEPHVPSFDLNFNERRSMFIAGSRELYTYQERTSLYITNSNSNLDEEEEAEEKPLPKQRKQKPSKDVLLGI